MMLLQEVKPIFSSDWPGVWHAIVTFGSMLLVIVGVIVKWGQSVDTRRMDVFDQSNRALKADIDGLGARVNELGHECTKRESEQDALRSRLDRSEIVMQGLLTVQGETRAGLEALRTQSVGLQTDLTALITETSRTLERHVQTIAIEVAELRAVREERDRVSTVLEHLVRLLRDKPQGGL